MTKANAIRSLRNFTLLLGAIIGLIIYPLSGNWHVLVMMELIMLFVSGFILIFGILLPHK